MRFPLPLFVLAALVASFISPQKAHATLDHPGHNPVLKCVWQADVLPVFPPGESPVITMGSVRRTSAVFSELVGIERWSVVVMPGFHVGYVYAMDRGAPQSSHVVQSYARRSVYGVYRSVDCCLPGKRAKATMTCGFRVRAAVLDAPASAGAQGVTVIVAANTQATLTAAAAATTESSGGGATLELEVPGPLGLKVKVKFNLDFDSADESVDEVSTMIAGRSRPAPDEEYHIMTDLNLNASADGHPFNEGVAEASLSNHRISLETKLTCGHCSAAASDFITIDGSTYGAK
jgi:hypothetical protein